MAAKKMKKILTVTLEIEVNDRVTREPRLRGTYAEIVRSATEAAREHMPENSIERITTKATWEIAARRGFRSTETLRQAFVARYGVTPSHHRATQVSGPVGQTTATTTAPNPNGTSSSMQNSANDLGTTSLRR
ncbi:hypothetical protein [Streptomyces sp. UH6]|uniref:hypothetical protein n=1 Tax=Streptomyces sp. UH6 TaxID=2748379 RepID=UPI0015D4C581|nr:hypothetical protein [Streptomyces sp. UH6]NYV74554.1 hypothetical protein [Streptomyces sp. UH6]